VLKEEEKNVRKMMRSANKSVGGRNKEFNEKVRNVEKT